MTFIERILGSNSEPEKELPQRMIGKIVRLHQHKGYGFISTPDLPFTKIFFHWSALIQSTLNFVQLKPGMKVEFTPIKLEDKGYRANHVKVIDDESN
jgi:cold shock CspA family protein